MKCDNYIVKPEKGIVVGVLDRKKVKNVWKEVLSLKCRNSIHDLILDTDIIDINTDYVSSSFRAVARCQGGDTFSEETGKKIVDLKVGYKYHVAMAKKYRQIIRELKKIVRQVEELEQKHYNKYQKIDEKLAEYL